MHPKISFAHYPGLLFIGQWCPLVIVLLGTARECFRFFMTPEKVTTRVSRMVVFPAFWPLQATPMVTFFLMHISRRLG